MVSKQNKHKIKSFTEVQEIANKDIIENLELQLQEMYHIADENFALIQKIINFDHELMACRTVNQVLKTVKKNFNNVFGMPNNILKITVEPKASIRLSAADRVTDVTLIEAIQTITKPVTGTKCIHPELYDWFNEDVKVESFLHLPLVVQDNYLGLLLVGHTDPDYFSENAPTDYVEMMAKSVAITLNRILENRIGK
ncbi:DUF484 family protein [Neisseriaceae bacterium PsAf]|nr:DUF484 family protein [Neisseriaceae bacterium PsAf]MCV2503318.1 DUF484 family protein [Neisseriaceae bacterium]